MILLRFLLSPVALFFQFGVAVRHILYDIGFLKTIKTQSRVFSVGNLTSGGTGKTPIVALLASWAQKKNIKSAIISRGYGVQIKGIKEVELSDDAAKNYGDEPVEIKMRFPDMPVYVGPSKSKTAQFVDGSISPRLMIVDDGFQHRRLHRHLDIVLLDATAPRYHYLPLPMGLAREGFARLNKADVIAVTKYNLATDFGRSWIKARLPKNTPIFYVDYFLENLTDMQTGKRVMLSDLIQKKVVLMAGLANHASFETLMRSEKMNVVEYFQFPDHHAYTNLDLKKIFDFVKSTNANCIVTTEKDAVKLSEFIPFQIPVLVAHLKIQVQNEKELYEILDRQLS